MDGSSHPEVFYNIDALEVLKFTRIILCFVLRSLEFVCERFFWGTTGLWSDYWIFAAVFTLIINATLLLSIGHLVRTKISFILFQKIMK